MGVAFQPDACGPMPCGFVPIYPQEMLHAQGPPAHIIGGRVVDSSIVAGVQQGVVCSALVSAEDSRSLSSTQQSLWPPVSESLVMNSSAVPGDIAQQSMPCQLMHKQPLPSQDLGVAAVEGGDIPAVVVTHAFGGEGPRNNRAQSLEVQRDHASGALRIRWVVDGRKLSSSDREAVSSAFDLALASGPSQFKMIL